MRNRDDSRVRARRVMNFVNFRFSAEGHPDAAHQHCEHQIGRSVCSSIVLNEQIRYTRFFTGGLGRF